MIQIRISSDAVGDLAEGFRFYDVQERGLGEYFYPNYARILTGSKFRQAFIDGLTGTCAGY